MSEDMSDMMKKISGMMNNGTIPDDIKNAMNNLGNNSNEEKSESSSDSNSPGINPEMINNIMKMFNNSNTDSGSNNDASSSEENSSGFNIDLDMMLKLKSIMDKMNSNKDDPRSNLLLSLKPYLKESRKDKVEQYIKFFNISKVFEVLKPDGGDKAK